MIKLKVTRIGDATGVVLSDEVLEKLGVADGDMLHVEESDSGIILTPLEAEKAGKSNEGLIWKDKDVLGKLADD